VRGRPVSSVQSERVFPFLKTPARSAGHRPHPSHASVRTLIGGGDPHPGACWGPGVQPPQTAIRRPMLGAEGSFAVVGTRIRVE